MTFAALAKFYLTEYFCNTKVAGLGEILSSENFVVYGNYSCSYWFFSAKFLLRAFDFCVPFLYISNIVLAKENPLIVIHLLTIFFSNLSAQS